MKTEKLSKEANKTTFIHLMLIQRIKIKFYLHIFSLKARKFALKPLVERIYF